MLNQFSRTQLLYGKEAMDKLKNSRVAILGLGSVGGYVGEALVRSGIGSFDLIDDDKICLTNLNRQIIATFDTVGQYKTDVMKERMLKINPKVNIQTHQCFFLPENASDFSFEDYDYIIDAIFGIGLSRAVEGRYAQVIEAINKARENPDTKIIAVDIASGISADNGQIMGIAVKADYTITFGYNKTGIMFYPGASYSGSVKVINAGFVTEDILHKKVKCFGSIFTYDDEDVGRLLVRKPDSNKGTYGRTLIIAGSKNMGGAAILSASAAYRSGTGLVKVLTHEINKTALLCRMPECLISTYQDNMPLAAELKADFEWAKSIAVGPGLSMNVAAAEITRCVLETDDKVRILDADALNIIAGEHIDYKGSREGQIIITPHIMEMSRLTGKTVADIKEHMIESAKEYAIQHSCICILKDARTVVTDGQKVYINCTGNDGMSTGGCGDVLTGLIAGMTAMGLDAFEAACLSVYVHGKAGDYAASGKGRAGMTAADVSEAIAYVLKR